MNRKMKVIEGYWLLFMDLVSIAVSYTIAILIRYHKFRWVDEPELHFVV